MKILALICARGKSKGIKNKNLLKFKKTTLLGNAIRQARNSKYISKVIVSTDSFRIAKEAKKNGAQVPFMRPSKLSTDRSAEIETWRHLIKKLKIYNTFDYIVSVPTTAPLRRTSDIDKCIRKAIKKQLDFVFSVTKSSKNPYFNMLKLKNNKLSLFFNKKIYGRRQDAPISYDLTTICYVFKPAYIFKTKDLFVGKTGFINFPKERAFDIDDRIDYEIAKFLS